MAISSQSYTGNGSLTSFAIPFDWISAADVVVTVGGGTMVNGTHYTIVAQNVVFTLPPAIGLEVKISRSSNITSRNVDFVNGSRLDESDLDSSAKQLFYLIQEVKDQADYLQTQIQVAASGAIANDAVTNPKILNGSVSPAKLSTGAPSWNSAGTVTATAFSGPLTGSVNGSVTGNVLGNVTGNVTGNVSGSSGSCTGNSVTATRFASAPAFSAYATGGQSLSATAQTTVWINTEEFDTNNAFDTTSYRFQPATAGYYQINGAVTLTTSVAGFAAIWKNGASYKMGNSTTGFGKDVTSLVYLNGSTDYVELIIVPTTAASTNGGAVAGSGTYLNGVLVKPV